MEAFAGEEVGGGGVPGGSMRPPVALTTRSMAALSLEVSRSSAEAARVKPTGSVPDSPVGVR